MFGAFEVKDATYVVLDYGISEASPLAFCCVEMDSVADLRQHGKG